MLVTFNRRFLDCILLGMVMDMSVGQWGIQSDGGDTSEILHTGRTMQFVNLTLKIRLKNREDFFLADFLKERERELREELCGLKRETDNVDG